MVWEPPLNKALPTTAESARRILVETLNGDLGLQNAFFTFRESGDMNVLFPAGLGTAR